MGSYCDNETVDGVEFPKFPESLERQPGGDERLVVADMSSNFLSRQVDVKNYAVLFGGAQKNLGTDLWSPCFFVFFFFFRLNIWEP